MQSGESGLQSNSLLLSNKVWREWNKQRGIFLIKGRVSLSLTCLILQNYLWSWDIKRLQKLLRYISQSHKLRIKKVWFFLLTIFWLNKTIPRRRNFTTNYNQYNYPYHHHHHHLHLPSPSSTTFIIIIIISLTELTREEGDCYNSFTLSGETKGKM